MTSDQRLAELLHDMVLCLPRPDNEIDASIWTDLLVRAKSLAEDLDVDLGPREIMGPARVAWLLKEACAVLERVPFNLPDDPLYRAARRVLNEVESG